MKLKDNAHLVMDTEQLPVEMDLIKCPKCGQVQKAKILNDWPEYQKCHPCMGCGHVIREKDWKSIRKR